MIYAAMTFWLLTIVLMAWGVHRLWAGMLKPKVFNTLLLPGTLAAQIGHVLGLLVTGATIRDTTLIKDDDSGEPETTQDPQPRIPVIGPVIIGMLPLVACITGIFAATHYLGDPSTLALAPVVKGELPRTMPQAWQLPRDLVTLVESAVNAMTTGDAGRWQFWLFGYLIVCLAIRMAPFPGYLRGSLGAIVVLGIGAALVTSLLDVAHPRVQEGWVVLNLIVAALLLLLIASLVIRGGVGLIRVLRSGE